MGSGSTKTLYFTHMPRSPQWMDFYQIWFRVSSRGRNQLCGILLQLAHGFRFCEGSKFTISHWLGQSLLTQSWRYCTACDQLVQLSSIETEDKVMRKPAYRQVQQLSRHQLSAVSCMSANSQQTTNSLQLMFLHSTTSIMMSQHKVHKLTSQCYYFSSPMETQLNSTQLVV